MSILDRVLASANVYQSSRKLIGAHREMQLMVERLVKPLPGQSVLDFGCGNGRLVPFLPEVNYIGVDNNASYIAQATIEHGGPKVRFICGDLFELSKLDIEPVDAVVSIGVLHHLDDEVARVAVASALSILKPDTGRLFTMDPCFEPTQHTIARVLMAMDRGRFVRHPADYVRLVERAGGQTASEIWTDVYRFPYTHCVQTVAAA